MDSSQNSIATVKRWCRGVGADRSAQRSLAFWAGKRCVNSRDREFGGHANRVEVEQARCDRLLGVEISAKHWWVIAVDRDDDASGGSSRSG
jgi:hypothetical protein